MDDPRSVSPGSIMPRYSWLLTQSMETDALPGRLAALRRVGVPYPEGYENGPAQKDLAAQAGQIVTQLKQGSIDAQPDKEIIALIAYLERLGVDIKSATVSTPVASADK
jgi:cytochrome c oxidase cbb3-type subunit I/II